MIDAKLKGGEGIDVDVVPEPPATNVIDLMAALRKSLSETEPSAATASTTTSKRAKSPSAKVPIPARKPRKRAS